MTGNPGQANALPDDLEIRAERRADHGAIADVVATAFRSSAEARLVEAIRVSPNFVPELSLVAEIGGQIVGHVMISNVALHDDETRHRVPSLSPLAVLTGFQGRGIGSALVQEVVARAESQGERLVVLEGDPGFYRRLGFEPAARHGIEFTLPSWAPPEAGQALLLAGYEPSIRGRVVYPPAFDVVSSD